MISSAIFIRYARSLADVALEGNLEPTVTSDLSTYREIFKSVPEVPVTLDSPAVPRDAKEGLLSALIQKYPVNRITGNFLRILVDHHRIRYFEEICLAYARIVNERKGIVAARVTAAQTLSEEVLARLKSSLSEATGRTVTLDVQTDESLLGGLVVQVGSTVYDGSIRSQLDEMKRRLAEA
jgi:F-type H+-transporting ATPase subunit delta